MSELFNLIEDYNDSKLEQTINKFLKEYLVSKLELYCIRSLTESE